MMTPIRRVWRKFLGFCRKRIARISAHRLPAGERADLPLDVITDVRFMPAAGVKGRLERLDANEIAGWALRADRLDQKIRISVFDGGRLLVTATADRYRPAFARDFGDGLCGFNIATPAELQDGAIHDVTIRLAGTSVSLLSTPIRVCFASRTADEKQASPASPNSKKKPKIAADRAPAPLMSEIRVAQDLAYYVFLIDLVQDVAVLWPIAIFAKGEMNCRIGFIISPDFNKRDVHAIWIKEIQELCRMTEADLLQVHNIADVLAYLTERRGMLFSASESHLPNHRFNHQSFLAAPSSFLRVTVQHGLECIGFNHNAAHDRAWGEYIGMGCDIAASWFEHDRLHSVRPDQVAKLVAVGPPIGLEQPAGSRTQGRAAPNGGRKLGLVCENLHSVRFSGKDVPSSFIDTFGEFARRLAGSGGAVELRPHPAGRYTEKQKTNFPANVTLNKSPLYKQDLSRFTFGISAPSSVLFDMVWAGIPAAVWTDRGSTLDIGIYEGLPVVRTAEEWFAFTEAAVNDPVALLDAQARYLQALGIPSDIRSRYRGLLDLVADGATQSMLQNSDAHAGGGLISA